MALGCDPDPDAVTERTAKVCSPDARCLYVTPLEGQLSNGPLSSLHSNLDPASLEVSLHGRLVRMPMRELRLLQLLMVHADRVVTREQEW